MVSEISCGLPVSVALRALSPVPRRRRVVDGRGRAPRRSTRPSRACRPRCRPRRPRAPGRCTGLGQPFVRDAGLVQASHSSASSLHWKPRPDRPLRNATCPIANSRGARRGRDRRVGRDRVDRPRARRRLGSLSGAGSASTTARTLKACLPSARSVKSVGLAARPTPRRRACTRRWHRACRSRSGTRRVLDLVRPLGPPQQARRRQRSS